MVLFSILHDAGSGLSVVTIQSKRRCTPRRASLRKPAELFFNAVPRTMNVTSTSQGFKTKPLWILAGLQKQKISSLDVYRESLSLCDKGGHNRLLACDAAVSCRRAVRCKRICSLRAQATDSSSRAMRWSVCVQSTFVYVCIWPR